jgi:hypothetical protein
MKDSALENLAKINAMRFLFARPSSLHDDPRKEIIWGDDGLPKLFRGSASRITSDDRALLLLYRQIVEREELQA